MLSFTLSILVACVCIGEAIDANKLVVFKLYNRNDDASIALNRNDSRQFSVDSFNPKLPTRIYIGGYLGMNETIDGYRQAFLTVRDFNFIAVDWARGSYSTNYILAKSRVEPVRFETKKTT